VEATESRVLVLPDRSVDQPAATGPGLRSPVPYIGIPPVPSTRTILVERIPRREDADDQPSQKAPKAEKLHKLVAQLAPATSRKELTVEPD